MISAALIVVLLAAAASFGSWLFSQWIGIRQRSTLAMLIVGGAGLTLLVGSATLAIIAAPAWWQSFVPTVVVPPSDTSPVAASLPVDVSAPVASHVAIVDPLATEWPATDCVTSTQSAAAPGGWFIDNECDRVVAVVFAWCHQVNASCNTNALRTEGWRYEPAGIVMTSSMQRPSRQRLGDDGPLVAATYALSEPGDAHRRIRYFACYVTAPEVLELLSGADDEASDAQQRSRLQAALKSDECYERVVQWSQSGQRRGNSPESLLTDGV